MALLNKTYIPLSVCKRGMTQGLIHIFNMCIYVSDIPSVKICGKRQIYGWTTNIYIHNKNMFYIITLIYDTINILTLYQ
jgi:hypothetical protein